MIVSCIMHTLFTFPGKERKRLLHREGNLIHNIYSISCILFVSVAWCYIYHQYFIDVIIKREFHSSISYAALHAGNAFRQVIQVITRLDKKLPLH